MTVREALRAATQASHERVDALFSRFDLANPVEYGRFLAAQAAAHIPVEEALNAGGVADVLPDWPSRQRAALLRQDLGDIMRADVVAIDPPVFDTVPALLGGVYVLEGSRLGGALMERSLPPGVPGRFLRARGEPGAWRRLLARMDELLYEPPSLAVASRSAQAVFSSFELAGRRVWDNGNRG
jgi:heme oxygenase